MGFIHQVVVKTVEVKVTDPKLIEEVDTLKEKVRTAETIWNDLEIQNTSLRKQLTAAQQQAQVGHPEYVAQKAACCRVSKFQSIKDSQRIAACSFISPHALGSVIIFLSCSIPRF